MDDKFLDMGNFHIPTDIMKNIPTARTVYHNYLEGQMKQMDETIEVKREVKRAIIRDKIRNFWEK